MGVCLREEFTPMYSDHDLHLSIALGHNTL